MRNRLIAALALAVALLTASPALATDDPPAAPAPPARVVESHDGPIFVTPAGMSLYFYGADGTTGKSNCSAKPTTTMPDPSSGFGQFRMPGYRFVKSCAVANPPF